MMRRITSAELEEFRRGYEEILALS